jgi:hypothetical protein
VSLQTAILKVLSCHPEGTATIAALNADLAILNTSGRDWTDRMKRLAACVPDLDLFSQRLVVRSDAGWQITEAGRAVLHAAEEQSKAIREVRGSLDAPAPTPQPVAVLPADRPKPAFEIVGRRLRRRRRRARQAASRTA